VRALAALALACACIPDPRGQCTTDADCASGAASSFCADRICQGPPRGSIVIPTRAFSRAETLRVEARVDRSHGPATARVLFGGATISATAAGAVLSADVPLSLAPAGVEGAVQLSVELRDDLGHATALQGAVLVDDRAPRITIDPASVPSAAVLRGTTVSLRVTVEDLSAVTVAGATRNADGSFTLSVDTRAAPSNSTAFDVVVTATDAVGNSSTAHATIPLTRLKFIAHHPTSSSVRSIVLSDNLIWGLVDTGEFWFVRRADGVSLLRPSTGGTAFPEIATDNSRLFFARSDGRVCTMSSSGGPPVCCALSATLTSGPILQGTTAIVGTSGSSINSSRLFAVIADTACVRVVPSRTLADFSLTTPALAPDGIIYAGGAQAIAAAQFDGVGWAANLATPESSHYRGQPAFRGGGVVLLSTTVGAIDTFTFTNPLGGPAPAPTTTQVRSIGTAITSPTIAADGTAVVATDDRHLIALRPDNSVRWSILLPDQATAPPSHGAGDLVYAGTLSGDILALHLADGTMAWSCSAGSPIRGPLAPGCDGILYAATDGSILALVLDASGLADSPWPRAAHDVRGTGDARRPMRSSTGGCLE